MVLHVVGEGQGQQPPGPDPTGPTAGGPEADWVVRAQDGRATEVLAEVCAALDPDADPALRAPALYAQAVALQVLGRPQDAVPVVRALCALCRDLGLAAAGLRARALLADLLRRVGQPEQGLDQLAHAVALEPGLDDVHDPEVQVALGALAVALRLAGLIEESRRIEARLAPVEPELPLHQRVSRSSNLAFEFAAAGLAAARRPPFQPDQAALARAVAEIEHACGLAAGGSYHIVAEESAVLQGLLAAVSAEPEVALAILDGCRSVLIRGAEAAAARAIWSAARVHALLRAGLVEQAVREGRELLAVERGGDGADRLPLAVELIRAEQALGGSSASGSWACLSLAEDRAENSGHLLTALFRSRVTLLRGADERRLLARSASLDSLTGVVNRRGAAAAIAAAAGRPDPVPVALLLVDLDGFARVNDTCGRVAGDVVLQRVAAAIRSAARPEDVVARWAGDRFAVVAELSLDDAVALATRIRDLIREAAEPGADDAVTASIGLAVRERPTPDQEWLQRAELALYSARRAGGDGVDRR